MHPYIIQQLPEFIKEYLIYCDCFVSIDKQRTCWALTRNLKFCEFYQKQLVAAISLQNTCLGKLKTDFENYNGPKSNWNKTFKPLTTAPTAQKQISLGKYVFHAIGIYKIYVIIQCWDKCVVLKRLPEFKGFEVKAQYEGLLSYRIIHGTIKYCPVLELKFQSNEIIKTDYEDKINQEDSEELLNKNIEMRQLLERIRCAKTELQLHKSITDQSFHAVQDKLSLGQPSLRTLNVEDKQILGRCGDIWKRFTAHDDLVIGVPLVNQCSPPNLSIIRNLAPVLQTTQSPEISVNLQYRLFQLKLRFDQLDQLELLLECEDEELQEKTWNCNGDLQMLPESFAVLLIRLNISQVVHLKEFSLILNYEVEKNLPTTSDDTINTFIMPLQLFLQKVDFYKLIFEDRKSFELNFSPQSLQQDFLTIVMTSTETNLKIIFNNCTDLNIFENFIIEKLDFLKPALSLNCRTNNINFKTIFYNKTPSSMWYGTLILRMMKETTEEDNSECVTTWKIYCLNSDKTLLLLKAFINDYLILQCNIKSISNLYNYQESSIRVVEFENALREELAQLQKIFCDVNNKADLTNLEKLYRLQLNTDIVAADNMES